MNDLGIRPLRRIDAGHWKSKNGRWEFMVHRSDPRPQRWYAFLDGDEDAFALGGGHTTLRDVVAYIEKRASKDEALR